MIVWGVIAPVAKEFRCHTPGRYGTKACGNGSNGCTNTAVSQHTSKRYEYRTGTVFHAI